MRSREYWINRSEELAKIQFGKAEVYAAKLKREYDKAMASIQRDIDVFYQRFASNNQVTMAEARKLLNAGELKEFKMTLEDFITKAKDNLDGRWTKELDNVYFKTRISRFEALQVQIRQQVELLSASQQAGTGALLSESFTDTYYRSIYEVQKGVGIGVSFAPIDVQSVERVVRNPWLGENFSDRIWHDKNKLLNELRTNLSQSFIRGDSIDRTSQALAKRMQVSYSNAVRIVRTESAHIVSEATWDGYKASGVVQKYEFLATLDNRTSPICQSMDLRVFKLSEKQVGINFPPLHPNCRSTICPYFEDDVPTERIARGLDGKRYNVPANMSYKEWYDKYVV